MKFDGLLAALALVCLFAANADAFAPSPLGALARGPPRATARKTAVSPLRMGEVFYFLKLATLSPQLERRCWIQDTMRPLDTALGSYHVGLAASPGVPRDA